MAVKASASDSKLMDPTANTKKSPSTVSLSKSENNATEHTISDEQLIQFKHWVSQERWSELKLLAENAMKDKKVFMIKGGGYPAVRKALTQRGWIEKLESHRVKHLSAKKLSGTNKETLTRVEKMIMFKFLEHHDVDLLWTTKRDKYDYLLSHKDIIISRFCRSLFTSKEGLCNQLTQMHWYTEPGACTKFPRCYNIHKQEEMEEFVDDFRLTACISLCRWFSRTLRNGGDKTIVSETGKVSIQALNFAISRIEEFVNKVTHKDIDMFEDDMKHIWEHEWDQFLTQHFLLVHQDANFFPDKDINLRALDKKIARMMGTVSKYWPQLPLDGVKNIWIVKPGNKCRGRGIQLMNNLKDIVNLATTAPLPTAPQKTRYVVQKYIENPLCVFNTKFDIRQWFLITCCQPLTIWMYKDSYLRFSSQIFDLTNYHESVHLTNNSVQSKYTNGNGRNPALPENNMWDCHAFKEYLGQLEKANKWDEVIYPGMKSSLIGAMLACQDTMDKRQNSFELYGADFMLTDDFQPWLIEINSSPDLAPTTSVTARMCPQCLTDVIKVVVDKKFDPDADTGTFELIYKQTIPKSPAYLGLSLSVHGKRIQKKPRTVEKRNDKIVINNEPTFYEPTTFPKTIAVKPWLLKESPTENDTSMSKDYSGPIITDLVSWLNPYEDAVSMNSAPPPSLTVVTKAEIPKVEDTDKKVIAKHRRAKVDQKIVPHSCVDSKEKSKNIVHKSVGNKRCYIDPIEWEKACNSINRSTFSFRNKTVNNFHYKSRSSPNLLLTTTLNVRKSDMNSKYLTKK